MQITILSSTTYVVVYTYIDFSYYNSSYVRGTLYCGGVLYCVVMISYDEHCNNMALCLMLSMTHCTQNYAGIIGGSLTYIKIH